MSLKAKFYRIYLPSYIFLGGFILGGFEKMGAILLSLRDAIDLLMLFFDRLRGLMLRLTAEFNVLAFYFDSDSESYKWYRLFS